MPRKNLLAVLIFADFIKSPCAVRFPPIDDASCVPLVALISVNCVGGGYTKNNVARCWTYETAVLVGEELDESIPNNVYQEYYQPDYKLNSTLVNPTIQNRNTRDDIDRIRETAMEYLRHLTHAPGMLHSIDTHYLHATLWRSNFTGVYIG